MRWGTVHLGFDGPVAFPVARNNSLGLAGEDAGPVCEAWKDTWAPGVQCVALLGVLAYRQE